MDWRKQLVDRTRHLKLGADRARQGTEMLILDGADVVRLVEAAGAGPEAAGVGSDADDGTRAAVIEELEGEDEWAGWTRTWGIGLFG